MSFWYDLKKNWRENREYRRKLYLKNSQYKKIVIDNYKVKDIGFLSLFAVMILCFTLLMALILIFYPYQTVTALHWILKVKFGFSKTIWC